MAEGQAQVLEGTIVVIGGKNVYDGVEIQTLTPQEAQEEIHLIRTNTRLTPSFFGITIYDPPISSHPIFYPPLRVPTKSKQNPDNLSSSSSSSSSYPSMIGRKENEIEMLRDSVTADTEKLEEKENELIELKSDNGVIDLVMDYYERTTVKDALRKLETAWKDKAKKQKELERVSKDQKKIDTALEKQREMEQQVKMAEAETARLEAKTKDIDENSGEFKVITNTLKLAEGEHSNAPDEYNKVKQRRDAVAKELKQAQDVASLLRSVNSENDQNNNNNYQDIKIKEDELTAVDKELDLKNIKYNECHDKVTKLKELKDSLSSAYDEEQKELTKSR